MSTAKKIRIEYYQVVKIRNDGDETTVGNFDLVDLIEQVDRLSYKDKMRDYYGDKARINNQYYSSNKKYWFMEFIRMRQFNIPSISKEDEKSEPMSLEEDEYIGENVVALYDPENHILALQRNRDSLSAAGLEKYFNDLYNNDSYMIQLRPFKNDNARQRIEAANSYQKLTVRFAKTVNETFKGQEDCSIGRLIKAIAPFEGNAATLTISMGNVRKRGLAKEQVSNAINIILENKDIVKGASVTIKQRDDVAAELIDLFAMKRHDFITYDIDKRETIDFQKISTLICEKYNSRKETLLECLN